MKTCKRSSVPLDEEEMEPDDPAQELGETFLVETGDVAINDLCPQCRQDLGILNLLGFGV